MQPLQVVGIALQAADRLYQQHCAPVQNTKQWILLLLLVRHTLMCCTSFHCAQLIWGGKVLPYPASCALHCARVCLE